MFDFTDIAVSDLLKRVDEYCAVPGNDISEIYIGFRSAEKALAECMKVSEMWKAKIKAAKAEIELLHPQMEPINPTWIIKFLMKEL